MRKGKKLIPNNLRKHRRLAGYTQNDVMRMLGLRSASMISRWERGLTMPSAENLLKLSTLYKTLVNELYYKRFKDIQIELFPTEREIVKPKRKARRRSDLGP